MTQQASVRTNNAELSALMVIKNVTESLTWAFSVRTSDEVIQVTITVPHQLGLNSNKIPDSDPSKRKTGRFIRVCTLSPL